MECLDCEKELIQIPKKRKKEFCNSTCRSNYWQKADRAKKNEGVIKPKNVKKVKVDKKSKTIPPKPESKWIVKERPKPPAHLSGLALRIWKDNNK